jgi:hypothetical protein
MGFGNSCDRCFLKTNTYPMHERENESVLMADYEEQMTLQLPFLAQVLLKFVK